jgi:pyridinium-3,5-biscarboxylic acid mononucleotide sulfurtransferase
MSLDIKLRKLKSVIRASESAVIAFSGGVDSSLVCAVSHEVLASRAVAVTAVSQTYPPGELALARSIAKKIGMRMVVIRTDELRNPEFYTNPRERCYYCKHDLLQRLDDFRIRLGFKHIFDGTNFDDISDYRPGLRAVKEFGVFSPLAEARLRKIEIRKLASKYGLPNSERPANPCLASRIPFGQRITKKKLMRIAKGEAFIRSLGFNVVRVRDLGDSARVEIGKGELPKARKVGSKIVAALKRQGYKDVAIDAKGYRSGGANL